MALGAVIFACGYLLYSDFKMKAPGLQAYAQLEEMIDTKMKNNDYPPYQIYTVRTEEYFQYIPTVIVKPVDTSGKTKIFSKEEVERLGKWLPKINHPYRIVLDDHVEKQTPYFVMTVNGRLIPAASSPNLYEGSSLSVEQKMEKDLMKKLGYETPQMTVAKKLIAGMKKDAKSWHDLLAPEAKRKFSIEQLDAELKENKDIVTMNVRKYLGFYNDQDVAVAVIMKEGTFTNGETETQPDMFTLIYQNGKWYQAIKEDLTPKQVERFKKIEKKWWDDRQKLEF
jgi:hypothetical protein